MDDDWERQLEEAEWAAMCRAYDLPLPTWTTEQRKALILRRCEAQIADIKAMIANAIVDPSLPDPRNWRF